MQSFLLDSQTFFDVSSDGSPPAISIVLKQPLRKYGDTLKDKLIMQIYDRASVISGSIFGASTLLREDYPFAHFFHCAAHRLNLVLCQLASSVLVKVFFAIFSAFSQGCADWGRGGHHAPTIFKFTKKLVKGSHAGRELATIISVIVFFLSNNSWSIGQNAPSPNRRCLEHHCF